MRVISLAAVGVTFALMSCTKPGAAKDDKAADSPFPQKGTYHVVHVRVQGNESQQDESDSEVDAVDREKLEAELLKDAGSNCHDKQVSIGDHSFTAHMLCDAPDGDFRNISVDHFGSFSPSSFEMTTQSSLMGTSFQESYSAHLKAN